MQETLVEQDIANLDLSNIAALQQKRTLAFVNHFVITTVQFLNNFMKSCEQRLMQFERKLEKVNATMVLLEAKLSSIPEVNMPSQATGVLENTSQKSESEKPEQTTTDTEINDAKELLNDEKQPQTVDTVAVNPEYERFLKMVHVGVPLDAVKLKLSLEGLNPQEFDRILKR